MKQTRALGILALVALLAIGAIWLLSGHGGPGTGTDLPGTEPAESRASALTATEAGTANGSTAAPSRTAVGPTDRAPVGNAFAITGRVTDDAGRPFAGAVVIATPGFDWQGRGPGRGGRQPVDFDPADFDPTTLVERFQDLQKQQTRVTTDAEGRFRVVPAGQARDVALRVAARGCLLLDRSALRPTTADVDLGTLALQRAAIVSGRVFDPKKAPVAGARVARRNRGDVQMVFEFEFPGTDQLDDLRDGEGSLTDAEGRFELAHVQPGAFALTARHPDHPLARLDGLSVTAGQTLTDLTIVLEPGAVILGKVVGVPAGTKGLRVQAAVRQAPSADPAQQGGRVDFMQMLGDARGMLADSGMAFGEKSATLDSELGFKLRGLRINTSYRVWVAQASRGFAGDAICSELKELPSGSTGVELRYDPGITVTFLALTTDSKPVERLAIDSRLQGGGGGGLQDFMGGFPMGGAARQKDYPGGKVTITNLRPKKNQTLRLVVEALGFATVTRDNLVLPTAGNLDLGPIEMKRAPLVHVTVVAADTGRPIEGVPVRLQAKRERGGGNREDVMASMRNQLGELAGGARGGTRSARTDAEGRCDLNALPGATGSLVVSSPDHAPYEFELAMPAEKDCEHTARLLRGGSVEVTVVGPEGKPVAKASVEHAPQSGRRETLTCGEDGKVTFERLATGAHRFRISERRGGGPDFNGMGMQLRFGNSQGAETEAGWQSVDVGDDSKHELTLTKSLTVALKGVVRENGVALAEARVAFVEGPGSGATSTQESPEQRLQGALGDMMGGGRGRNTRTGEDGKFSFEGLPAGPHRLRITHRARVMPYTVDLNLRPGENSVDVDLEVTLLRGTVRDPQGNPVAGASVTVRRADAGQAPEDQLAALTQGMPGIDLGAMGGGRGAIKTGNDGTYEIKGVQSVVRLQVAATAKGFARGVSEAVQVPIGGVRDGLDVRLSAAGTIQVSGPAGGMFQAARATLLGADGNPDPSVPPALSMLRRGGGTLEGLRPGRWKVEILGMNGTPGEPKFADVEAGKAASLNF